MAQGASADSVPRRYLAWLGGIALLILLSGLGWYFVSPSRPPSSGTLENWVKAQNYEPLRPMRSAFVPGTLMQLSAGQRDRMAMAAGDFLGEMKDPLVVNKLPDMTLKVTFSAGGHAGVASMQASDIRPATGDAAAKADLRATLMLSEVETLTLPLDKLKDLVSANKRVQEALRDSPDNLFVVLESLRVGKLEFRFDDKVDANLLASLSENVLKPTFAGDLSVAADGAVRSSTPLVVGAHLAKLNSVSNVLGGNERTVEVIPLGLAELQSFRKTAAAQTVRLYSGYDVHALVMGLGNYPVGSVRAGGQLPEAIRTAELVAGTLRQMLPASEADRVRVVTSEESSPGIYDATKRLSRQAIVAAVGEFVAHIKRTADPTRQTLVMFYFFGHGVADGMTKSVLLVPENFVDDASKKIPDLAARLVNVDDVAKQLSKVTDKVVLLVDACRAHNDEAGRLREVWEDGLGQQANISGILNALQFSSGIFGPHAMVFASEDGVAAPTVALPEKGINSGTGPIAAALANLYSKVAMEGATLDLAGFLQKLTTPVSLGAGQPTVRGYTFMRQDFVHKFGDIPILSAEPVQTRTRGARFRAPGEGLVSRLGAAPAPAAAAPSGASLQVISELPDSEIRDIAVSSDGEQVWILDWAERVHRISPDGRLARVNPGLPSMAIAWDKRYGLVLAQWDSEKLYALRSKGWEEIASGVRPNRLMTDGSGLFLVYREAGQRPQHRLSQLSGRALREVGAFDSDELLSTSRTADGRLWKVEAESVTPLGGEPVAEAPAMWRPTLAAAAGDWLYLLSEDARMLFRIGPDGRAEQLDLFDVSLGDGYLRPFGTDGFRVLSDGFAFIATGTALLRVDLRRARWLAVTRNGGARRG